MAATWKVFAALLTAAFLLSACNGQTVRTTNFYVDHRHGQNGPDGQN